MKVAIITDQHFGARKSSRVFHDFFLKFYNDIFFPTLKKHKIKTVIDLGDTFDNRRNLDLWSIHWARNHYYNVLRDMGIKIHAVVGNHTTYFKDTNHINTLDNVLCEYSNIQIYSKPTEVTIGKLPVLFIPWINSENQSETFDLIKSSNCDVAMGHLELNGFEAHRGHIMENGHDTDAFHKFKKVFSGHYHHRSTKGNISYLGNPYQIYWNDYKDVRGFHIFDTETLEAEFIPNTYEIFDKIPYDESSINVSKFNYKEYTGKIVKIIIEKKSDSHKFDFFLSNLYGADVHDIKIIEDTSFEDQTLDEINLESEDTLSVLEKFVDELDHNDKNSLKKIIKSLYIEASEIQ